MNGTAARTLFLAADLREAVAREAQAALPRECCGLIEGVREGPNGRAIALHPVENLAAAPDRFALDPVRHIALGRAAREAGHAILGCYHSHPNGRAEPSDRDRAAAGEEDFFWLIAAISGGEMSLKAFVYAEGVFAPAMLADPPP